MVEFAGWEMPLSYNGPVGDNVAGGPGEHDTLYCWLWSPAAQTRLLAAFGAEGRVARKWGGLRRSFGAERRPRYGLQPWGGSCSICVCFDAIPVALQLEKEPSAFGSQPTSADFPRLLYPPPHQSLSTTKSANRPVYLMLVT